MDIVDFLKPSKNKSLSSHGDLKAELCYSLLQIRSLSDSLHINKNNNKLLFAQELGTSQPVHKTNPLKKYKIQYKRANHKCYCQRQIS